METNSVINLEDIMVCDPISKRGREAMSRVKARVPEAKMTFSDFYNQIYVAPFFLEKAVSQNLEEDKTQQDVYETGTDFSFSPAGVSNEQLNRDKMTYEEKFFSKKSNLVLFLRAFSGAGKSIYLNELKWKRKKQSGNGAEDVDLSFENGYLASANELSFDLEECISTITKGNVTFPSSDYVIPTENNLAISAPWCFFCTLLEATFDMILSFIVRNDKSDCDRVENNFKIIYGVNYPDETGLVFTLMKHKENGKIDERDISSQLLSTLLRVSFSSTIKSTPSVRTCISNLLQIMTRVIACKSNLFNPNQVLISLDNIEHFIKMKRRIFDKDIDVIVDSVVTFMREEEVYYKKRGLTFAEFFKVVFVVRDTTSKMLTTDVHEDYYQNHCSSINISNWYRAEEIYENKLEYFKNLLIFAYPSSDFFQLIIEDGQSGAPTSIMKQVSCMYNQNKRRITRILARVAGVFDHQRAHPELNHGVLTYEQFKSIWDKNAKDYAKFLCRQAILRLVFNEISKTGYFKRISGHSTSIPDEKRTYARRILTFLANERVLEGNWDNDYVGFYKLTKNVFCSLQISNENITIENFKGIAEILIALDEFRFSPESEILSENTSDSGNRWCQLVTLKMNDINPTQNDTVDMLATQMLKEYEKQSDNNRNKFGVKITDAGYFFAKQLCYFEFFASQCDNRSTPLIFMTEVEHIKDTIRKVYQYSEQYINNALNFEYNFFHGKFRAGHQINYYLRHISNEGNVSYQPLAYRIIFRHCDYLRAYKQYIDDETTQRKNNVFSANERSSLSRYINLYIEKYRDLYDKIDGPSYMINDKTEISHYFSNYFNLPSLWKENSILRTSLKQE